MSPRAAKTAGTLYQAALRYELRQLGLRFVLRPTGTCEIAGVPAHVLRAFSRRRAEIEAHMAARGEASRPAAQVAALATRQARTTGCARNPWRPSGSPAPSGLASTPGPAPGCSVGPGRCRPARRGSPAQRCSCSGPTV